MWQKFFLIILIFFNLIISTFYVISWFFSYVMELFYLIILTFYVNFDFHNQLFFLRGVFSHNFNFLTHRFTIFFLMYQKWASVGNESEQERKLQYGSISLKRRPAADSLSLSICRYARVAGVRWPLESVRMWFKAVPHATLAGVSPLIASSSQSAAERPIPHVRVSDVRLRVLLTHWLHDCLSA